MQIVTAAQLVNECKKMAGVGSTPTKKSKITYYASRWGYVYSADGQMYTQALAAQWGNAKRAGKSFAYYTRDCARWYGHYVTDCSGMIVCAYRAYRPAYPDTSSSAWYNNKTSDRGPIKTMPEEPGLIVWKQGHIGVYIGGGLVIEARGYKHGVVASELSSQKWTNWGRLAEVKYPVPVPKKPVFCRELRYTRQMMRGDDVKALQRLLQNAGLRLTADGIFGKRTRDAVKSFQREKSLRVDGIAGEKTITALGGEWR